MRMLWQRPVVWVAFAATFLAGGLVAQSVVPALDAPFAVVNGKTLTHADFYTVLQDQAGRLAAERAVLTELLHQEAAKQAVAVTQEEIDERVTTFIDEEFGGKSELFVRWLYEGGLDEGAVRRQIEAELLDLKLRTRDLEVSDAKLREFFEAHRKTDYDRPDLVRYRQIVCDTEEKAKAVLTEIQEGRLTFLGAATRHSIDRDSAAEGGLLPPQVVALLQERAKPIFDALAPLGTNQVTPAPVEYGGKWFLLVLIERIAGEPTTFEAAQSRVRHDYLVANAKDEDQFMDEVLQHSTVTGLPVRFRVVEAALKARSERGADPAVGAGPTPPAGPGPQP